MSEPTRTPRAPADKRLTYQQWKRRKMLRLARNWVLRSEEHTSELQSQR